MGVRVYKYGLLPPKTESERLYAQMQLAHKYYNRLVEIERERRQKLREAQGTLGKGNPQTERAAELNEKRKALQQEMRDRRKAARARVNISDLSAQIKQIDVELKPLQKELSEIRKTLAKDPTYQAQIQKIQDEAKFLTKQARGASGLYWGTYQKAERDIDLAKRAPIWRKGEPNDPKFRRYTGGGYVRIQLIGGLKTDHAFENDTRLRINPELKPCGGKGKWRPTLYFRIGSNENKTPIFAEFPIIFNRDLPPGEIREAEIVCRNFYGYKKWSLHLTIRTPDGWVVEKCGAGEIAIDLGWRKTDRGLRIATGHDGEKQQEFILHPRIISGLEKVSSLQSIRDRSFLVERERLWTYLQTLDKELSDDFKQRIEHFPQWKSKGRLWALYAFWKNHRFAGDEENFVAFEAWARQDRHLALWEGNQRRKSLNRRKDEYRCVAAKLARTYRTLIIEDFDLSIIQERAPIEEDEPEIGPAKLQRKMAAPFLFRQCLVQAFAARGGCIVTIDAKNTTVLCHQCGTANKWDKKLWIHHRCTKCGTLWDQDENACLNLLKRYTKWVAEGKDPEGAKEEDHGKVAAIYQSKFGKLGFHKKPEQKAL